MSLPFFPSGSGRLVPMLLLLFWTFAAPDARAQATDLGALLRGLDTRAAEALDAALDATRAPTEAGVKQAADRVFAAVWGVPSGLAGSAHGAARVHGWKTRWQVNNDAFDPAFAARYGTRPPAVTDPAALGIIGQGRAARRHLEALLEDEQTPSALRLHAGHVITSLNNVIGWMKMDDGVTKGERQPRVDLTRRWDAPQDFWLSTADTGWMQEVYAQAMNILKTDYEGDLAMAHEHAAALVRLLEKCRSGVDADGDGRIAPVDMEGGLAAVLTHAALAGLMD